MFHTHLLGCLRYQDKHVKDVWQVAAHWVIDPTQVQNFRPASLTVFEILGFKLKNENDKIF